jgi:hypothetical protein
MSQLSTNYLSRNYHQLDPPTASKFNPHLNLKLLFSFGACSNPMTLPTLPDLGLQMNVPSKLGNPTETRYPVDAAGGMNILTLSTHQDTTPGPESSMR